LIEAPGAPASSPRAGALFYSVPTSVIPGRAPE